MKIPFRHKVKAWWDGVDLEVREPGTARQIESEASDQAATPEQPLPWEADRVQLLQAIWGSGFSSPGGTQFIQKLLQPFGLNERMSALDLGAGLGGATRAMASVYGARTIGLEADKVLAEAGMELSKAARLSGKAAIRPFDVDKFAAKANAYDCIFSKEFMFSVREKIPLLVALRDSLSESGQLQIIDYVLTREDVKSPWLEQWTKLDERTPFLWTSQRYRDSFENFGFRIMISEDISDGIYTLVSQALSNYMKRLGTTNPSPGTLEIMGREIHAWESRMRLLKEHDIRISRFHLKKRPSGAHVAA